MRISDQPYDHSRSQGCFLPSTRFTSSRLKNLQLIVMPVFLADVSYPLGGLIGVGTQDVEVEVDRRGIGSRLGWHVELLSMVAATSTTALAPIVAATPVRERTGPADTRRRNQFERTREQFGESDHKLFTRTHQNRSEYFAS